ncbi:glucosaminidase domain-containing protein [Paraburkholderia sp.]|uniref:glucosaminidase domain-containing protein n=1 Tax=Paraburkholderia sp. TaxID=1926495 RepID=UPI002384B48B|nr:glucosaminidase domain-containing protein [Paraburkholderia sp.]MDE1180310.1 LysM peptidoglycan-binding domain-containing protein [Paraburkholderia sp.]
MTYSYEQKIAFIKGLYCPARQVSDESGCSWELILAQAAQETGWGEKVLQGTNNVFNIKADASWTGESKVFRVWEKVGGKKVWVDAAFRVYDSVLDSLRDRQAFLRDNSRYTKAGLFRADVKGNLVREALALQDAHYATDEDYADNLAIVFNGKSMRRAIAEAKADGCKGCLPIANLYLLDAARVPLARAKVKASQAATTVELVTDADGHVQVQAALSRGPVSLSIWSAHDRRWIAIPYQVTPALPAVAITLIAPTLSIHGSTTLHRVQDDENVSPPSSTSTPVQSVRMNADTYTIKKGDSLSRIARLHGTNYQAIAHLNGIASPYFIQPGQVIAVPKRQSNRAVATHQRVQPPPTQHAASTPPPTSATRQSGVHAIRFRNDADHPQTDVHSVGHAPWMTVAEREFRSGVKRHGGAHPDAHVMEYFSATSLGRQSTDQLAYCAAFVNWCLTRAGYRGNNSAMARSLAAWGRPTEGNRPAYGAVAVVRFPGGGFHVTFVNGAAAFDDDGSVPRLATLGGNQGYGHEVSRSSVPIGWVTHFRFPAQYEEVADDYALKRVVVDGAQMTHRSTH